LIALLAFLLPPDANAQLTKNQKEVLNAIRRNEPAPEWIEISVAQARTLHAHAEVYLRNYKSYHEPFGLTADILFSDRTLSKTEKLEGIGDAATWTGHYLAAMSFRYSCSQEFSILADLNRILDTFEILTEVTGKKKIHLTICRSSR